MLGVIHPFFLIFQRFVYLPFTFSGLVTPKRTGARPIPTGKGRLGCHALS